MTDTSALAAAMGELTPSNPSARRREDAPPPCAARLALYGFSTEPLVAITERTSSGASLLLELLRLGDLPMVLWLRDQQDVPLSLWLDLLHRPDFDDRTPLFYTVTRGDYETTKFLMEAGGAARDLHLSDVRGAHPILLACRFG